MGFRAEVRDFQPYYTFNPKFIDHLRIGAEIIHEAVKVDTERRERMERAKKEEKAAADAVKHNVS